MHVTTRTRWFAAAAALVVAAVPAATPNMATAAPEAPAPATAFAAGVTAASVLDDLAVSTPEAPRSPTARETLAEVRDALAGPGAAFARGNGTGQGSREMTLLLRDLTLQLDGLSRAERKEARGFLARPTSGANDPDGFGYRSGANPEHVCEGPICVHWATATEDAPPTGDNDKDGLPNQVETTMAVMQSVWNQIVTEGGYRAPKKDKGADAKPKQGPNRKFDVYLTNLGDNALFGYCNIDPYSSRYIRNNGWDAPGFCVLDDDFSADEYGNAHTPNEFLKVTAAHEFFHAVQFGYDFGEDRWLMEGTAAWIEDELFDDINDNLGYLDHSQLAKPKKPLDFHRRDLFQYGSWIWWRYLGERFPAEQGTGLPVIIKDVWKKADDSRPKDPGTYSIRAAVKAVNARKAKFRNVYAGFGEANRHPAQSYEEGASYPAAPLLATYDLGKAAPTIPEQVATMPHLTNFSVAFRPKDGLDGTGWRLKLVLDAPNKARGSVAQVTVYKVGGGFVTKPVKLNRRGNGTRTVGFRAADVARVELTMTNAGTAYKCWEQTNFSCQGKSKDDGLRTFFKAKVVK